MQLIYHEAALLARVIRFHPLKTQQIQRTKKEKKQVVLLHFYCTKS